MIRFRGFVSFGLVSLLVLAGVGRGALAGDASAPVVPSASDERSIVKQCVVRGAAYDVWWAWSTSEGLASFFAPESSLDLKVGGKWELYMGPGEAGSRGSEGCKLLAFVPYEMLAFEWTSPPSIPELRDAGILTRVVVEIDEIGPAHTQVTLTHSGFGKGDVWDRNIAYFEKAWSHVLANLTKAFDEQSPKMRRPAPTLAIKEWEDGGVVVRSNQGDWRWQSFEMDVPASVDEVWRVLATSAGMKRFMGGQGSPEIELKTNGKYAIWPGATNRVTTYANQRMLAVTGSAPEKFPEVRKGGTFGVYRMSPNGAGGTRLRLTSMGWEKESDEWKAAYAYFLSANAQYMNMVRVHLGGERIEPAETRTLRWLCDLDVSSDEAWRLFTTKAGIESWMVPLCEVDFRVGGTIKTNYNKAAGIGGPGTIVHHILTYEQGRMYSGRFKAPENAKAAKGVAEECWGVTTFEPRGPGRSRVCVAMCGWGRGEDWDRAERFFTQGNHVTLLSLIRRTSDRSDDAPEAVAETAVGASEASD